MSKLNLKTNHATLKSYSIGFVLSILLTLIAFYVVQNQIFTLNYIVVVLIMLSITQLFIQLYFFLHINNEAKPRWNIVVLLFMLLVLSIVVFGSLWIMKNLDYGHMRSGDDANNYIMDEEGIRR